MAKKEVHWEQICTSITENHRRGPRRGVKRTAQGLKLVHQRTHSGPWDEFSECENDITDIKVAVCNFLTLEIFVSDLFWRHTDIRYVFSWSHRCLAVSWGWETILQFYFSTAWKITLQLSFASHASNWLSIHGLFWTHTVADSSKKTLMEEERERKREKDRAIEKTRVSIRLTFTDWRELRVQVGFKMDAKLVVVGGRLQWENLPKFNGASLTIKLNWK